MGKGEVIMETNIPMISGDDYNAILEESSLQEAADEVIQDTNDLTHETASVIEETIDVINSTEDIEAAENAGLLSAITVKAYSNRVNSYLDKLESRHIITKDDKLKPGLQFDNPQAGLLSVSETLKNAVRKVIEWIAKAFNYLFGFADLMQSNREMWKYNLIWQKTQPTGFYNAKKMPLRWQEW